MHGLDPMLVVIVRDTAVRSTLVARLAMSGAAMCTAHDFGEWRQTSARGAAVTLITDQAAIDAHPGGAAALLGDPQWRRIIVLVGDVPADDADPRLHYVEKGDAAAVTTRLLAEPRRGGR